MQACVRIPALGALASFGRGCCCRYHFYMVLFSLHYVLCTQLPGHCGNVHTALFCVALYVDTGHCLSAANDCACNATECTAPLPAHPSLQHAYTAPRLVCSNNSLQLMVRGRCGIYILWVFTHMHTGCTHVDANESPGLAPCPLGVHRPPR
jgi:hypothetical protein